ncbi:MAG: alpha/beta hydrolase [Myxococcota bacterium]|nr:alpha/beta hydrolase [Myxococcota bacterium]
MMIQIEAWSDRVPRATAEVGTPSLDAIPPGKAIDLYRGRSFFRELDGPRGAPTLLLLHGWIATGGLNWFPAFDTLGRSFRVIAPDLRGHGRGIRSWRRFRLEDCADDSADLITELDAGPVIAVGYSMGGAVAQLLWQRHPELVSGLVLCATGPSLIPALRNRIVVSTTMSALAGTTRLAQVSTQLPRSMIRAFWPDSRPAPPKTLRRWAANEMARHDWRMLLEAGRELGSFSAWDWIHEIDVPTAVVVTTRDNAMDPAQQFQMAERIPGASIHPLEDGHLACTTPEFAARLLHASREVALRAERPRASAATAAPLLR